MRPGSALILFGLLLILGAGLYLVFENYPPFKLPDRSEKTEFGKKEEDKKHVLKKEEFHVDVLKVGLDFYREKKYNKAIDYLKQAVERLDNTIQEEIALFYIADSYAMLKKTWKALNYYEKVLSNSITARDQLSLLKIGQLYFDMGKYKQALYYFVALQKDYPDSKYKKIALDWEEESRKSLHAYNYYVHGIKGSRPE